ncbi:hypothetical protein ABZ890_10165 [Streptomyces sp. NPDC046984]|uniref:hypothetical protein n=1 Tax=Streptomyces sp. NPDC046984 TaxID=3155138 RepID=UPI0033F5F158
MNLAAQLRELRMRSGNPSYRDLERLIARQGRKRPMARSTIQEKLSGRSSLNLTQVLSIVEALGEYARINNAPLSPQEIDQKTWSERITESVDSTPDSTIANTFAPSPPERHIDWNTEPLRQAEMFDLAQIFDDSQGKPVAQWLPEVFRELIQAGVDLSAYLESAASDTPQGLIQTIAALNEEFPRGESSGGWGSPDSQQIEAHRMTVGELLDHAARGHGITASPAIVTGLRRAQIGQHVSQYLRNVARFYLPSNLERIVEHLRSAALPRDANRLLGHIGSERSPERTSEVVKYFQEGNKIDDRNRILRGVVGEHYWYHAKNVVQVLTSESASDDVLMEIARGVPYGKHAEYAEHFRGAGLDHFAAMVAKAADEPPF